MVQDEALLPYFDTCEQAVVDSHRVVPGALFFALKGKRVDGHNFLEEAAAKGAKGAVVRNDYSGPNYGLELFFVKEPLDTLQGMAKARHRERGTPVIGVTGSVGKTSTKEAIAQLLSAKYVVGKTPGNSNSQVGVPLAILNHLKGNEEIAVFEMGLSHQGNLNRLIEIAPPKMAVITEIGLVHAANFTSIDMIARAKGEILSSPKLEKAVINEKLKKYPFKSVDTLYYRLSEEVKAPQLPDHLRENLAAAIAVARHFGIGEEDIAKEIAKIRPFERRFETFEAAGITVVNDAYNASELSMIAALNSLPKTPGKRVGILGEMLELGSFSRHCHENVAEVAVDVLDEAYLVGEGCEPILHRFEAAKKPVRLFSDVRDLFREVRPMIKSGDLVLLKGSRFWGLSDYAYLFNSGQGS